MNLAEFLHQAGYQHIPLTRSGVGHFHAAGTLGDRPVSVVLDTGAASTVVSLSLAQALGLDLTKTAMQGGGAGAARMDVYQISGTELRLAGLTARTKALMAMDLSNVNEALALQGENPVDVILGVDVFEAQAAIIDYGSSSLYLRP